MVRVNNQVIDGWVNIRDKSDIISEETYDFYLNEILSKRNEGNWVSLDNEFEYKKFITKWKVIQHQETILNSITVKIIEVQLSTGNKYIIPYWSLSSTSDENRLYKLKN